MKKLKVMRTLQSSIVILLTGLVASCGFNFYGSLGQKRGDEERAIDAQIALDNDDYEKAEAYYSDLLLRNESNDFRLNLAAARLGVSGLGIYDIFDRSAEIVEKKAGGGLDEIVNGLSPDLILGSSSERDVRLSSLENAILLLTKQNASVSDKSLNAACLLGVLLSVAIVSLAKTAVENSVTALQAAVQESLAAGQCSTTPLTIAFKEVDSLLSRFNVILDLTKSCPALKPSGSSNNAAQQIIDGIYKKIDRGCASVCKGCEALFPTCVQQTAGVGDTTAIKGDNRLDRCEIVLNCAGSAGCF